MKVSNNSEGKSGIENKQKSTLVNKVLHCCSFIIISFEIVR